MPSDKPKRTRRQFTAEFKRVAVELVRTTDRPIAEIARELGIYDSTLGADSVRRDSGLALVHLRAGRDEPRPLRSAAATGRSPTSGCGSRAFR
jgi:transposase-like protein